MRAKAETFNASWAPYVQLGDFGLMTITRPKHPPLHVPFALRPRGAKGLIEKARYYLNR